MPLLTTRKTNNAFAPLVDRINNKIRHWQSKLLTQVGRLTLIKSVLSPLTYYQMQTTILPRGVSELIDKSICSFLWGDTPTQKHVHLLAWETITKTKSSGGLGIRDTKYSNDAFLTNQAWRLWKNSNNLWTKFLKHKHFHNTEFLLSNSTRGSYSWKALLKGRELLTQGLKLMDCRKWPKD